MPCGCTSAPSSCPNIPCYGGNSIHLRFPAEDLNPHEPDLGQKHWLPCLVQRRRNIERCSSGRALIQRANILQRRSREIFLRNVRRDRYVEVSSPIRWKQIVHRPCSIWIEKIEVNPIAAH